MLAQRMMRLLYFIISEAWMISASAQICVSPHLLEQGEDAFRRRRVGCEGPGDLHCEGPCRELLAVVGPEEQHT